MKTIKKYPLPADGSGWITLLMPPICTVLGVSHTGVRGIVALSSGNDDPERYAPKKFLVLREGDDAAWAADHRYLGDLVRVVGRKPAFTQYVFECLPQPYPGPGEGAGWF